MNINSLTMSQNTRETQNSNNVTEKKVKFFTKETAKTETIKAPENETVHERFIRNYNRIVQECHVANEPEGSKVRYGSAESLIKDADYLKEGLINFSLNKEMYTDEYTEAYIKMYNSNYPHSSSQYSMAQSMLNSTISNDFFQPQSNEDHLKLHKGMLTEFTSMQREATNTTDYTDYINIMQTFLSFFTEELDKTKENEKQKELDNKTLLNEYTKNTKQNPLENVEENKV